MSYKPKKRQELFFANSKICDFQIKDHYFMKVEKKPEKKFKNSIIVSESHKNLEYFDLCISMKLSMGQNIIPHENDLKKINLILDIDSTLIYAINLNDTKYTEQERDQNKDAIFYLNSTPFNYRFRPHLFEFLNKLKKYCNFYVSTLSHIEYAEQVIKLIYENTKMEIPSDHVSARGKSNDKNGKNDVKYLKYFFPNFKEYSNEINNTIILDDSVEPWVTYDKNDREDIEQSIKCLLVSKKFYYKCKSDPRSPTKLPSYDMLSKERKKILNVNIYCSFENDKFDNQLSYLRKYIEKCFILSYYSNSSIVKCMEYYRKKIFDGCKFKIKYNTLKKPLKIMIRDLGGEVIEDKKSNKIENDKEKNKQEDEEEDENDDATHYIFQTQKKFKRLANKFYIRSLYIYDCYFSMYRFDENESRYNPDLN